MRAPSRITVSQRSRGRRGFVLIVTLIIAFAIASMVLTLGRLGRTEALASANQLAQYEAASIERGAEQYILAILANQRESLADLSESDWAGVPVGNGYFWVVRPDYLDDDLPAFGLVDESAKLHLNSVTAAQLTKLSNMTQDVAEAIVEWRTSDTGRYSGGGYAAKAADYETPEELLMVQGVTRELYLGEDALVAAGGTPSTALIGNDALRSAGWRNFFSPWGTVPNPNPQQGGGQGGQGGQQQDANVTGYINVNEAPREVLLCINGLDEGQVDTLLARRPAAIESDPTGTEWVADAIGGPLPQGANIVGQGRQFSADIVAAAGNGRAFKRVRIVVDTMQDPPRIVYRRDVTADGFPLDASLLTSLRDGSFGGGNSSSRLGGSSR
jgi:type II secretory pathway component PulK